MSTFRAKVESLESIGVISILIPFTDMNKILKSLKKSILNIQLLFLRPFQDNLNFKFELDILPKNNISISNY